VLCRRDRLGFAAEDEAATLAAFVRGVVNLLPESDEVVDCGDDRYDGHPVDGGDGDEVDADDVSAAQAWEPQPVVPAVSQDGCDDGDDLDDSLELADLAGLDGEALGRGDGAQARDEKLATDDKDGDPGLDDARGVGNKDDVSRRDHELVGEGIEKDAHGGDLFAATGEVAVETVCNGGENEDDAGDDLLLAPAQTRRAVTASKGEDGREDPDEQRKAGDAAHRDGVGQVHREISTCAGEGRDLAPTIAFCHSKTRERRKGWPKHEAAGSFAVRLVLESQSDHNITLLP
jgi:hypothetical protein